MTDFVHPTSSTFPWPGAGEADNMWRKLGALYSDVLQHSWQEWLNTSTQIVQQQAVRALLDTSQALFENAAQLQQKTWGQLWNTNQQAATIMADGMARAATEAVNKVTSQVTRAASQAVDQATSSPTAAAGAATGAVDTSMTH